MILRLLYVTLVTLVTSSSTFNLAILHTNDVSARVTQFNKYGVACSAEEASGGKCYGGVARRYTKIKEIKASHGSDNVVVVDAGDQFMGTLWFTVYKGEEASYFMQQLGYDIMSLGNHEFDLGVAGLVSFLDKVTFSVVCANIDVSMEPSLQGKFNKSHILTKGGEKIGFVGFIAEETKNISNVADTVQFTNIIQAVTDEVNILQDQGINKIIAVGHADFEMDMKVAAIQGVDVVVGAQTDVFLYTGDPPSNDEPTGVYPTVVQQKDGKKALVVQDFMWGKYLGYLNVTFDENGDVLYYNGNPILLDKNVTEDSAILKSVESMGVSVDGLKLKQGGYTNVYLAGEREVCRLKECNLGNLITDAFIDYHVNYTHEPDSWAPAAIALYNGGGIRSPINKGQVTTGDILTVLPFANGIDMIKIKGSNLRKQLETSVRRYDPDDPDGAFLQVSGLKVVYDLKKPAGQRVIKVDVRCLKCSVPSYSPLKDDDIYTVLVVRFHVRGGDGFSFEPLQHTKFDTLDAETLSDYFKRHSPVWPSTHGRITFHSATTTSGASRPTTRVLWTVATALFCTVFTLSK